MTKDEISPHYERVRHFMILANQRVRDVPTIPTPEERMLRAKLLLEETLETIHALGCSVNTHDAEGHAVDLDIDEIVFHADLPPDLSKIADGCADVSVINIGTMISCGIFDLHLLKAVDENNLAKFGPGGSRRPDGKWVKPPGHVAPDLNLLLHQQRMRGLPGGTCPVCYGREMITRSDGLQDSCPRCIRGTH